MDRINRWKLADELTTYQIALLIAGYDPSEFEEEQPHQWPKEVTRDISPFLNAIKNAARSEKLKFTPVRYESSYSSDDIDWNTSTVDIESRELEAGRRSKSNADIDQGRSGFGDRGGME